MQIPIGRGGSRQKDSNDYYLFEVQIHFLSSKFSLEMFLLFFLIFNSKICSCILIYLSFESVIQILSIYPREMEIYVKILMQQRTIFKIL